jgi:hypothetical protein
VSLLQSLGLALLGGAVALAVEVALYLLVVRVLL